MTDDIRTLRRFVPDPAVYLPNGGPEEPDTSRTALIVDSETTGLSPETDEIIELAIVPITYAPNGEVYDAGRGFSWLNDPGRPIPPEVTELTGITDAMVQGQRIDLDAVESLLTSTALVVAHNARFDRPFCERLGAGFAIKPWACSLEEVRWKQDFGAGCRHLGHLLMDCTSQFHTGHRALDDCHATVNLLANARHEGRTALSYLLESARVGVVRVYATGSPFGAKDALKARGYRWDADGKVWHMDVPPGAVDSEREWLAVHADVRRAYVRPISAKARWSARV